MPLQLSHRALYASFDRFPSAKGAATHIARMAATLFDAKGGGLLYVLGGDDLPIYQREESIEIFRYAETHANFLDRVLGFGRRLKTLVDEHGGSLELCHFRDPWSGVPLLGRRRRYAAVYEVNGLPSIELPYTYPHLSPATIAKIRRAEEFCWTSADAIVTPSSTIAENLVRLGADGSRITVIPNGADPIVSSPERHPDAPGRYILYFGALQRWQGIDVLLRAFARLADLRDLHLVICASAHHRHAKIYRKLAERLGVAERIIWRYALGKEELGRWLAGASLTVAPLVECSRNLEQGCAPLKILESMACGIPVVASDLPAVREIASETEARLVRPDRPAELARAIRVLLDYPEQLRAMGERGREKIVCELTWEIATAKLAALYRSLDAVRRSEMDNGAIFAPSSNLSIDSPSGALE